MNRRTDKWTGDPNPDPAQISRLYQGDEEVRTRVHLRVLNGLFSDCSRPPEGSAESVWESVVLEALDLNLRKDALGLRP